MQAQQGRILRRLAAVGAILAVAAIPAAAQGGHKRANDLHLVQLATVPQPLYGTAPGTAPGKLYIVQLAG